MMLTDLFLIAAGVLGLPALFIATAVVNAFVLVMLWGWYVSPYFSVPSLDMIHAFGLAVIVNLLRGGQNHLPGSKAGEDSIAGVNHPMVWAGVMTLSHPLYALLFGWIGTFWL